MTTWEQLKDLVMKYGFELLYCHNCKTPMVAKRDTAHLIMNKLLIVPGIEKEFFKCCKNPLILWLVPPFTPEHVPERVYEWTHYTVNRNVTRLLEVLGREV